MARLISPRLLAFTPRLNLPHRGELRFDLFAGLTVAAVAIPQALAYAWVAGLPGEMGLVAAALPCAAAAFFGSSPYLVTGPTNPTALLLGTSIVMPALASTGIVPMGHVLSVGLLVGLMLLAFATLGIGRTSRFLSDSVIVGFATGTGLLIALRLLPELTPNLLRTPHGGGFIPQSWPALQDAGRSLASADPRALLVAIVTAALILGLRRIDVRFPAALVALAAVSVGTALLGWDAGPNALPGIGEFARSWTSASALDVPDLKHVAQPAFAIAILVTLQSVAAARSIRPPAGSRLDPDRELFGQGAGNIVSALVGGMVTCGSLTRTAVARSAGGRSRLTAVVAGGVILVGLPGLGLVVNAVPMPALVGLVVLSGIELVDPRALRRAATTRGDALVLLATLGSTLWIDLVQALYVGLFLSLALLVRRSGDLQIVELVRSPNGRFREIEIDEQTGSSPAVLLHLEGDLNFAIAGDLSDRLVEVGSHAPQIILLRLKRARHLDATVLETLREAAVRLRAQGTRVVLSGLTDDLAGVMEQTELGALLGEEGILRSGDRLFEGFERSMDRARMLLDAPPDQEIFRRG
ncbi:MAG TPA: SulP family inorganic anion transporter [Myxococcales bacterium]|nr:SulP family inorganic anion transporter [Myxococcales bacterium]